MDFEDLRRRAKAARNVRTQRDAAESKIAGEKLRRALREAFAREDARKLREDREVSMDPDPPDSTNT
jgi:hypothetical protein